MVESADRLLRYAPEEVRAAGVDLLVVDQGEPGGGTVADGLGIPFVSVCNALPLNQEPLIPPPFVDWEFQDSWWPKLRNSAFYKIRDVLMSSVFSILNAHRKKFGVPLYRTPDDSFSNLLQFTQMVPGFDFPHERLPEWFHYVGTYEREAASNQDFPWHLLDGRDLVYASLGTIVGNRPEVWRMFAGACEDLKVQAVISLGGLEEPGDYSDLPGRPVVVKYAPQVAVLRRSSLLFTHAGLNTVMEALACGVPMVAVPIAYDQPGVGTRLVRSGVGEVVRLSGLNAAGLRKIVAKVIAEKRYRENAVRIQQEIGNTGGAAEAAELIERVLFTGKPVFREK
jgi:zeaxanthin glucosyltransferase